MNLNQIKPPEELDQLDLGPCCACEGTEQARNLIMMDRLAPEAGKGWGCLQCGLPCDGAVYVLCDRCLDAETPPRFVIRGRAGQKQRAPIADLLPGVFEHDLSKHPEYPGERRPDKDR